MLKSSYLYAFRYRFVGIKPALRANAVAVYLSRPLRGAMIVGLIAGALGTCAAQSQNGNTTGTKPFWTYLTNRETVSPAAGSVLVKVPLLHLPGRDGHDLDLSMVLNVGNELGFSAQLIPVPCGMPGCTPPASGILAKPLQKMAQWQVSTPFMTDANGAFGQGIGGGGCTDLGLTTEDGATYTFGMASWGCVTNVVNGTVPAPHYNNPVATDDSGAGLIIDGNALPGPTIYLPNGKRYVFSSNGLLDVDANNNYITYVYAGNSAFFQTIIDTLGRKVTLGSVPGQPETTSNPYYSPPNAVTYYDSNGKQQSITINYGAAPAATQQITVPQPPGFVINQDPGTGAHVWENPGLTNFSQNGISSIVFPDGSSYSFQYDWIGDLIKIGYPDGGYTRYEYAQFAKSYSVLSTGLTANWVAMQLSAKYTCSASVIPFGTTTIAPGNTCTVPELITTYQPTPGNIYNNTEVVTEPEGTRTTYQFNPNAAFTGSSPIANTPWSINTDHAPVEMSHTTTDASGNILEQVETSYESDYLHPSERTTTTLYGQNIDEQWTYATQALSYGGVNLEGAGVTSTTSPSPNLTWAVESLKTETNGGNVKRLDYTLQQPGFVPNQAYFAWLTTEDDLYDYLAGGYIQKTRYGYDAYSPTTSGAVQNLASFPGQTLSLGTVRGNRTSESGWSSTDNAWIGSTHKFDDAGNILQTVDARGNSTAFSYADSFSNKQCIPPGGGHTDAYLTNVTNPLGQSVSATYNSCTGTKATTKDANQQTTTYTYWSPTDELESVSYPDGGLTSFCYDNIASCAGQSSARNFVITTQLMTPDPNIVKESDYDGLGHSVLSVMLSDPCELETSTLYDKRERVYQTSFPFFGKTGTGCIPLASNPVTTYLYNGINLPTSVQVTGSAAKTWTYLAQTATETDENGNQIARTLDNMGRLATVMEPNAAAQLVNETDYQYDAANNLKQVDQWGGAQGGSTDVQRLFTYDTLSRLTQSLNPEAGTIKYKYDYNGNLTSQTDARNITTSRIYDVLNRVTQTLYSDGTPTECFSYDSALGWQVAYPVGRETSEWTQAGACTSMEAALTGRYIGSLAVGSTPVGYDTMGRLLSDEQFICPPTSACSPAFLTQYSYNKGGALISQTINGVPVGSAVLSQTHDAGGRTINVSSNWPGASQPPTVFKATGWTPAGMASGQLGLAASNIASVTVARGYDTHGRTVSEADTASAVTAVPTVKATASIGVSMSEQHTTPAGIQASATITFAEPGGTDQYSSVCSCYETGIFTFLTDVGMAGQTAYIAQDGTASTPSSIAASLATSVNSNSSAVVTASSSGPYLTITSKVSGSAADYPFAIPGAVTNSNFTTPSFTATPSMGTMTGGVAGSPTTVYDSGTASVTVGTLTPTTISWTSADTAATIATRLAAAVTSAHGTVVTAAASGSQVNLTAASGGTAGDMSVQTSVTFNGTYFGNSSVTFTTPAAMTGGVNGIAAAPSAVAYQYSSGVWQDNGNLKSVTDSLLGAQTFIYGDHLNRLTGASFNGAKGNFGLNWSYDAFGNRLQQAITGTSSLTFLQPSPVTYNGKGWDVQDNRVDNQQYDASGNLTLGYQYDAASRISVAGITCYLYDAQGRRVAKGTTVDAYSECGGITNMYVLGPGGEQLSEFDGSFNWKHTNVYGAGKLLATYDANGTHFHLTDWLGTMRAQVGANGVVEETCIDMPFGDNQNCSGTGTEATEHHFTGKVRDTESGLDYFGARYYASPAGRWMSPDWSATAAPVPYAKLNFPQSLNLYAYVENNPLTMADADGHAEECVAGGNPCKKGADLQQADDAKQKKDKGAQQQNAPQTSDNTLLAQNTTPPPPGRTPAQGGAPGSTVEIPDGKGGKTVRTYGPDGRAVVDVDHGHDHGAGDPHAHDWDWGAKPPRQPGRPLTPAEQANIKKVGAGVVVGIGTGYIIYRVIRFLPSLAPPLWPTIPANALIP